MRNLSIIITLVFAVFNLQGQITQSEYRSLATSIPSEKIELTVNSSILLSGEYLYYQAYTLDLNTNVYSQISKILYIEMLNANQEQVFKQKLKVQDNVANGEFFIPAGIESGHYKLIAYTNWSKNNSENSYDQVDIFVVNPFTKHTQFNSVKDSTKIVTLSYDDSVTLKTETINSAPYLKLSLKNEAFKTRSPITLSIANSNIQETSGSYSINVRKIDPVKLSRDVNHSSNIKSYIKSYHLPELRGEIISGTVLDKLNKNAISNKTVSISFPEKTFIIKTAQTNAAGKFYFNLDKSYTTETAFIQVVDLKNQDYTISIDKQGLPSYGDLNYVPLALDENIKEWLEKRSIETQIENSYFEIKADSTIKTYEDDVFFGTTGITYKLDDYNRFPTLRQTFTEVISEAYISRENDTVQFHTIDLENLEFNRNFSYLKPLVLMDGIVITNNDDIINFSANKIESITVIPSTYLYGPQLHNGVISMVSFNRDFSLPNLSIDNTLDIIRPTSQKRYYQPNYSKNQMKNVPDYRSQLLWKPHLKLEKEQSDFEFYTSDSKGSYQITLEGYSKNGVYSLNTIYFEVE